MPFKLKGQDAMERKIRAMANKFPGLITQAVRVEAEVIMTTAKRNHVPVDLGALRNSGFVGDAKRKGKVVSIAMMFGGSAAPYAIAVHENPGPFDPPSWRGVDVQFGPGSRGPKYLEIPLKAAVPGMAKRIGSDLAKGL